MLQSTATMRVYVGVCVCVYVFFLTRPMGLLCVTLVASICRLSLSHYSLSPRSGLAVTLKAILVIKARSPDLT
jgi:hypothetical protein